MSLFKNEVLNTIRELESKFFTELSRKNAELNFNLTSFNEKVNSILDSNRKMIESVTSQKLNFEKIKQLESNMKYRDEVQTTHDIKISFITSEMEKMKFKYDKIISENVLIPGYIGHGCNFKNLKDFIVSSMEEIRKLKDEKEVIKREEKDLKSFMESKMKNITSMVDYNSTRIKEYAYTKENEIESMFDDKFKYYNEKSLQSNKKLIENQNNLEEKIKEISHEIGQINNKKNDFNSLANIRFEEINKKEDEINQKLFLAFYDIKEFQKMKKELAEEIKNIYSKIDSLSKNSNQEKTTKASYNSSKNVFNLHSYMNKNPNINISNNYKNIYNIKNYGSMIKSTLPNMKTNTIQNNEISDKKPEKKSVNKNKRKELNFIPNSFSDKKFILKENNLIKTTQNHKERNINKKYNFSEDKKKSSKAKEEKDLSKIIFDKIRIKGDEKVLSDKKIKNFFTTLEAHFFKKNLKLANLEYNKKVSSKLESISQDEDLEKSSTLNNINTNNNKNATNIRNNNNNKNTTDKRNNNNTIFNKKNNETFTINSYINNIKNKKLFNALNNNNNKKDLKSSMVHKKAQTPIRSSTKVDCYMVNLNLLDVPNINDKNLSNYSRNEKVYNIRKINSVDSKRKKKNIHLFEKIDFKFYNSKNKRRHLFNIYIYKNPRILNKKDKYLLTKIFKTYLFCT